jgi:hypothetical protein
MPSVAPADRIDLNPNDLCRTDLGGGPPDARPRQPLGKWGNVSERLPPGTGRKSRSSKSVPCMAEFSRERSGWMGRRSVKMWAAPWRRHPPVSRVPNCLGRSHDQVCARRLILSVLSPVRWITVRRVLRPAARLQTRSNPVLYTTGAGQTNRDIPLVGLTSLTTETDGHDCLNSVSRGQVCDTLGGFSLRGRQGARLQTGGSRGPTDAANGLHLFGHQPRWQTASGCSPRAFGAPLRPGGSPGEPTHLSREGLRTAEPGSSPPGLPPPRGNRRRVARRPCPLGRI